MIFTILTTTFLCYDNSVINEGFTLRNLIKRTLIEIRNDVVALDQSDRIAMKLFDKHDLVFRGKNLNTIFVNELIYKLDLEVEDYIDIIPNICNELNMKFSGVITSSDLEDPDVELRNFIIELF